MEQPGELVGRALVVVVDDRTAHGDEEDHSGPLVTELLGEAGFVVDGVVVDLVTGLTRKPSSCNRSASSRTSSRPNAVTSTIAG